jgi:hypothetical protein
VWPNADVIDVTPTDRPAAEYVPARVDL